MTKAEIGDKGKIAIIPPTFWLLGTRFDYFIESSILIYCSDLLYLYYFFGSIWLNWEYFVEIILSYVMCQSGSSPENSSHKVFQNKRVGYTRLGGLKEKEQWSNPEEADTNSYI